MRAPAARRRKPPAAAVSALSRLYLSTPLTARSLHPNSFRAGGHHGEGVTHAGLTLHKPARWHVVTGKGFAAAMWFWVLYRFYHDHDTFLFGHAQHHEHELHAKAHAAEGGGEGGAHGGAH